MITDSKRKPTLCKAATEWKHEEFSCVQTERYPGTVLKQHVVVVFNIAIYNTALLACAQFAVNI